MNNNRQKRMRGIIAWSIALAVMLFASSVIGVLSNHKINEGASQLTSDQQLVCTWTLDVTTIANVTWYKNGQANLTQQNISCTAGNPCATSGLGVGIVPEAFTSRSDVWVCSVTYDTQGSGFDNKNVSVTIIDSPPTPPRIFYQNNTETTNSSAIIPEDSSIVFIVNSTDADGDTITYLLNDTTFCGINSASGALNCTPTAEAHIGNRTLRLSADTTTATTHTYFNITVTSTNDAPTFSPVLQNRTVNESQSLNYTIYGIDAENDISFNFTVNTTLSSVIIERVNATAALIRFNNSGIDIATFADRGNHTINVTISDNSTLGSKNYSETFVLQVVPQNHVANISYVVFNNNSLIQGGNLSIYINATDTDNDTITFISGDTTLYPLNYTSSTDHTDPNNSFAYAWINITGLTNNHVISPSFTIYVYDSKQNATQAINMFINNTNDAPIMYDISSSASNTLNNTNITNITAYNGVLLTYVVNASDVDTSTYAGETLIFATNDSNFSINSSTGILQFTPNEVGNFSVNVSVTDNGTLSASKIALIHVLPNNPPTFTQEPIIIPCFEYDAVNYAQNCTYNISANVSDADAGDSVALFWTNASLFSINNVTGMITFRPNQTTLLQDNHSIMLNVTDTRGAANSTAIYVLINNTNNRPNITSVTLPSSNMVVNETYVIYINASDRDLSLTNGYETLNFSANITGPNTSIFSIQNTSATQASITIAPTLPSHAGNYTINISVEDFYDNISTRQITILIYNRTNPPTLINITPFGSPIANNSVNTTWYDAASFPGYATNITIEENSTYTFNQTSSADNSTQTNSLNFTWTFDGVSASVNGSITKTFNFSSSGNHNMSVLISDQYGSNLTFTWYINVTDVNRNVTLMNPLANITVSGTTTYDTYMTYYNSQAKFYDADDDINFNNVSESTENRLTFRATTCPYANFTFLNTSLYVKTIGVGSCFVNFTATDYGNSSVNATAYNVLVNVTAVSDDATTTTTVPDTSTSTTQTTSQDTPLPVPLEIDRPKPLELITPKLVTVYKNATIKIPIILNNTWNGTLKGISLNAYTSADNVTVYLDKVYFPSIEVGQEEEATLVIQNYKGEGHYEVQVSANVTDPRFRDIATIFVNSADQKSEGDQLEERISFARDLLSSNPECQELTELLTEAKKELQQNNYVSTARLVDSVINGCKYLVNEAKQREERPDNNIRTLFEWKSNYNEYLFLSGFALLFMISLYYIFKKEKNDVDF